MDRGYAIPEHFSPPHSPSRPPGTSRSVLNLLRTKYGRCSAQYFPKKPLWYVYRLLDPIVCTLTLLQILWYNKSRGTSRICPACERLYHLGDVLPDLLPDDDEFTRVEKHIPPQLGREQELSGLCAIICCPLRSCIQTFPRLACLLYTSRHQLSRSNQICMGTNRRRTE